MFSSETFETIKNTIFLPSTSSGFSCDLCNFNPPLENHEIFVNSDLDHDIYWREMLYLQTLVASTSSKSLIATTNIWPATSSVDTRIIAYSYIYEHIN